MDLAELNPPQQAAVRYLGSPLLVLAGAGSGKTRVIINKIAYLIQNTGLAARHIAAVTFTNKAAREMKTRLSKTLKKSELKGLQVSTFHTLGLKIIRQHCQELGYQSNFSIFDSHDSNKLLQNLSEKHGMLDKDKLQAAQHTISNWKNAGLTPKQAEAEAEESDKQTAYLYDRYQRQLKAYNAVDFDDLIALPVQLFASFPEARTRWQAKIRYLLVDEYQDTNSAQYELVKYLVGSRGALTVVGDDDQSIYAWRGAQPENLALLKTDYPQLHVVKLEQNYRSSGYILAAANKLISHNEHVFEKRLWSDKGTGAPLRVLNTADDKHEAEQVVSELISHKFQHQNDNGDYAVLYRSNYQSRLIEKALRDNRIEYIMSGGTSFFERAEIKDIIAYLRLIVNGDDDAAFVRIVNTPRREIGMTTLEKLGNYAQKRQCSLFAASFEMGLSEYLSERAIGHLEIFNRWITELGIQAENGVSTQEIIRQVINGCRGDDNYEDWLQDNSPDPKTAERKFANVEELISWFDKKDELEIEPKKLAEVVAKLSLSDMLSRQEQEANPQDYVRLSTLHAAKGLEFPHVFLIGMEEDLLPHANSKDDDQGLAEERRLAYVGITRAERSLTFSLCRKRRRYGEEVICEPSRFLAELPQDQLTWEGGKQQKVDPEQAKAKAKAHLAGLKSMLR